MTSKKEHGFKIGDLVYKSGGYKPANGRWFGLIVSFALREQVMVLSSDNGELEKWQIKFIKKID